MYGIQKNQKQFQLSFKDNFKNEKQQIFSDIDVERKTKKADFTSKSGEKSNDHTNQLENYFDQLQILKSNFSICVKKYKLVLSSILDSQNKQTCNEKIEVQCDQNSDDNLQKVNYVQKSQEDNQIYSQEQQNQLQNCNQILLKEDSRIIQLKEQLNTQLNNLNSLHNQILDKVDNRNYKITKNMHDLDEINYKNQQDNDLETQNIDENNILMNKEDENQNQLEKESISIYEANTFIEESIEDELQGYFGKRYQSNGNNNNSVSFLGEMKQVLNEKSKKPQIQQKIVLDTEEEKINYQKSKLDFKQILEEKRQFQSTTQNSLLSELKFVMRK